MISIIIFGNIFLINNFIHIIFASLEGFVRFAIRCNYAQTNFSFESFIKRNLIRWNNYWKNYMIRNKNYDLHFVFWRPRENCTLAREWPQIQREWDQQLEYKRHQQHLLNLKSFSTDPRLLAHRSCTQISRTTTYFLTDPENPLFKKKFTFNYQNLVL